jgi:hypothetical protein
VEVINTSQGVGGILNSFKGLVEDAQKITFVGTPGFCTPFAELIGFAVRDKELAFVSSKDFEKARSIFMDNEGMQLGELTDAHADVIVLLVGLSMPKIGISPEKAKEVSRTFLDGSKKGKIIGICFQSAFMKQKWDEIIDFDYIISSDIAVKVLET